MTRAALRPYLSGWMKLNELFQSEDVSRQDLLALLDMERKGLNRESMKQRIIGRLKTVEATMRKEGKL